MRECPFCGRGVLDDQIRCRFCERELPADTALWAAPSLELKAAQLPWAFTYKTPSLPPPRREALRNLDDWELYLRWELRKVVLLGEIDLSEGEHRHLRSLIAEVYTRFGAIPALRELAVRYPCTLAVSISGECTFWWDRRDFWEGMRAMFEGDVGAELARVFEAALDGLGLPRFPGIGEERLVTPIVVHGMVPQLCLGDLLEKVLFTNAWHGCADAQDLVDTLLRNADAGHSSDSPCLHFLEHGGKVAVDFLERCRRIDWYLEGPEVTLDAEWIGLPSRVVSLYVDLVCGRKDGRVLQLKRVPLLKRPKLVLDPSGEGVAISFPRQTLHMPSLCWKLQCTVSQRDLRIIEFCIPHRGVGEVVQADEVVCRLPEPLEHLTVSVSDGNESIRNWSIRPGGADIPLLAFEPSTGERIAWETTLPSERLWLLYPSQWTIDKEVQCLRRFEEFGGGWREYRGGEYDLRGMNRIIVRHGRTDHEILLTRAGSCQSPHLIGGTVFLNDADVRESPLYIGRPPSLYLPIDRDYLSSEEMLSRWRLWLMALRPANPERAVRFVLRDFSSAVRREGEGFLLDLSDPGLLGPSPAGSYHLEVQGPLGLDTEFRLRVWPDVRTEGLSRLNVPCDGNADGVVFKVGVPEGCLVEKQAATEISTSVSEDSTESSGLGWYEVRAHRDSPEAHVELAQIDGGKEQARLSLTIEIPRLRWSLARLSSAAELQGWTTKPARLPLEALLAEDEELHVLVCLPSRCGQGIRLRLGVWDEEDHLIHQGKLQSTGEVYRNRWRLPLGEFRTVLRETSSSSYRFGVRVTGRESAEDIQLFTAVRQTGGTCGTIATLTG